MSQGYNSAHESLRPPGTGVTRASNLEQLQNKAPQATPSPNFDHCRASKSRCAPLLKTRGKPTRKDSQHRSVDESLLSTLYYTLGDFHDIIVAVWREVACRSNGNIQRLWCFTKRKIGLSVAIIVASSLWLTPATYSSKSSRVA